MNAIAGRLRAAAERLEEMSDDALSGPWTARRAIGHLFAVHLLGPDDVLVAALIQPENAVLIAALRSMTPVIAKHLSVEADRFDSDTKQEEHYPRWHNEDAPGCGRDIQPVDGSDRCTCWDAALALADAILGPVTA